MLSDCSVGAGPWAAHARQHLAAHRRALCPCDGSWPATPGLCRVQCDAWERCPCPRASGQAASSPPAGQGAPQLPLLLGHSSWDLSTHTAISMGTSTPPGHPSGATRELAVSSGQWRISLHLAKHCHSPPLLLHGGKRRVVEGLRNATGLSQWFCSSESWARSAVQGCMVFSWLLQQNIST